MTDTSPSRDKKSFACPYCGAFAQQSWFGVYAKPHGDPRPAFDVAQLRDLIARDGDGEEELRSLARAFIKAVEGGSIGLLDTYESFRGRWVSNVEISSCIVCDREALWVGDRVVYPAANRPPIAPNADLPENVRFDYLEAAAVLELSPRAAAALLRLALQKLCSFLLGKEGDINTMIGELVRRGLPATIQKALDLVRVVGNEAVHPGQLDLRDDRTTASQLFMALNLVAEVMISQPKHIAEMYDALPASKLQGIANRDKS